MKVWDYRGRLEFAPVEEIRAAQTALLREHLAWLMARSPYYKRELGGAGVTPAAVTPETLHTLPFTTKADLGRDPEAFLAVPRREVVDIVLSSGTTGQPTAVMYTENDLRRLSYNEEISFAGCGVTADDTVLLTCTIDRCFIAGLAYYAGARALGAAVVRNGLCSVASHLEVIRRLRPTVLVGVPTFLLKLGEYLRGEGLDPAGLGVKALICIGEPIRDRTLAPLQVGARLEAVWGAPPYSTYASSETISSFCECSARRGGHLHPELAIVEIVAEDGTVLPPGEVGEVVTTPLAIEGMPLLRFKTGDMSFLVDQPCPCGRTSVRLGPILGRKAQMMKVRGTTLYPQAIYAALDDLPGVGEYYVSVAGDFALADEVTVHVAVTDAGCTAAAIGEKLQARLRVQPRVAIEPLEEVRRRVYPSDSRKPVRFVDERRSP
ncbi:MAG: phenylacetate--CoA ligase [Deltaproteobacteria bacterium]|nr:MAG: phenylacetate--CoA ligase [Deltaproteobacteria bacterium]